MYWINFLHLHQPPNQEAGTLKQVDQESYQLIFQLFDKYPNIKATLNISGSLLEQMRQQKDWPWLEKLKKLIQNKRVELTASVKYHPILPLLPTNEIQRQIQLHQEISRDIFGPLYRPRGFFLPEMAYGRSVARLIEKMGFSWIILDEIHFPDGKPRPNILYQIKNTNLKVIFRNRHYSKSFPPESIITNFNQIKEQYLITAHDGEMYGHWHKDQKFYHQVFTHTKIKTLTVSEYLRRLKIKKSVSPRAASWESTEKELKQGIPLALWSDPKNKIHQQLWELRKIAIKVVEKNRENPQYFWARNHLDRGLSSCSWWWAAEKKPDVFSPVTWNPNEIEKGLKELINSVRSLEKINPRTKLKAEKIYLSLIKNIWHKHWKKYA